jgi:hypothetical protein
VPVIFNDADEVSFLSASLIERRPPTGLKEIDVNISGVALLNSEIHQGGLQPLLNGKVIGARPATSGGEKENEGGALLTQIPSFKRSMSGKLPMATQRGKRNTVVGAIEGRENVHPQSNGNFSQSVGAGAGGRRRSPRTAGGS